MLAIHGANDFDTAWRLPFCRKEGKRNIGSVVQIAAARNPQVELHREHFLSKRLHKAVTLASELVKKLIIVASFLTSPGGTTV